jgi:hypothetical protein
MGKVSGEQFSCGGMDSRIPEPCEIRSKTAPKIDQKWVRAGIPITGNADIQANRIPQNEPKNDPKMVVKWTSKMAPEKKGPRHGSS